MKNKIRILTLHVNGENIRIFSESDSYTIITSEQSIHTSGRFAEEGILNVSWNRPDGTTGVLNTYECISIGNTLIEEPLTIPEIFFSLGGTNRKYFDSPVIALDKKQYYRAKRFFLNTSKNELSNNN